MAYLAEFLVPGLCLYSSGRKQNHKTEAHSQHYGRVASDRTLAWGELEFCGMGSLLWTDPHDGEIPSGRCYGTNPCFGAAGLYNAAAYDRMGAVLQSHTLGSADIPGKYGGNRSSGS